MVHVERRLENVAKAVRCSGNVCDDLRGRGSEDCGCVGVCLLLVAVVSGCVCVWWEETPVDGGGEWAEANDDLDFQDGGRVQESGVRVGDVLESDHVVGFDQGSSPCTYLPLCGVTHEAVVISYRANCGVEKVRGAPSTARANHLYQAAVQLHSSLRLNLWPASWQNVQGDDAM